MSSINFGGSGATNAHERYYTATVPTLSGDFTVWAWIRNDSFTGSTDRSILSWGTARSATANSFDLRVTATTLDFGCSCYATGAALVQNNSPAFLHLDDKDGGLFLLVVVRSGSTVYQYCVQKGGDASASGNRYSVTGRSTADVGGGTAYIGAYAGGSTSASWIDWAGEIGILNGTALTEAQITTMAAGAQCPVTPTIEWRFNSGANSTEANTGSGGSSYDATRTGTGFTTGDDFFAALPSGNPIVRSWAQVSGTASTAVNPKPKGVVENDVLVWTVVGDFSTGSITWPGGWSGLTPQQASTADEQTHATALRVAGASEGSDYTATLPASGHYSSVIVAVANGHATQPDASNGAANSTAGASPHTVVGTSVTTTVDNALLLHFAALDVISFGDPAYTVPSGFDILAYLNASTGWTPTWVSTKTQTSAGASGTVNGSATSGTTAGSTAWLVAIAPAANGQKLAPSGTVSSGAWVPSTGATLWGVIDEAAADDADYISTITAADVCEVSLPAATDPASSTGHVVRYRLKGDGVSGITVTLRQSTTTIASWTHDPAPTSWTSYAQTLTGGQADSITDYSALRLKFEEV